MTQLSIDGQALTPGRRDLADRVARRCWPLAGEGLREAACRQTSLSAFGEPSLEPALSVLTGSLENEANLHPLGRFLMQCHLKGLLRNRLRLVEEWGRTRPSGAVERPLFITGMPRSGSTFLHELLAQDPVNRVPRVYEVMFPCGSRQTGRSDPRIGKAEACLWFFRRIARRADSVHPLRAQTPQECTTIHSYTFLSEEFLATSHIPSYEAFLHAADLTPAYAWERRFLQHLQSGAAATQWVLKSPDHAHGLGVLFSVFPDAQIVQTHRNPVAVLKSCIRLLEVLQGVFARPMNRQERGMREARMLADAMDRFIRFRETHPELAGRFLDVSYDALVADPIAAVRRIYEHLERPLTQTAVEAMERFVATRTRYQRRGRAPTLADLGLGDGSEANRFKRYCSFFGIPWHPAGSG
jgi:Sulfotransferase family